MPSPLISIIGADGSGKTTLANKLMEELDRKGYPARYVWFRFPRFLTMVLLLVSRLTGFTIYKNHGKYRVGIHYFQQSPFQILYPTLALVDAIFYYLIKVWIPSKLGYIIVCDRWIYDILIDIAIDTQNSHFFHPRFGRLFYGLASGASIVLLIDASDEVLDARRPETCFDPNTKKRRLLYRLLSNLTGIYLIDSSVDFSIKWKLAKDFLEQQTRINFETRRRNKVYVDVKSPLLNLLLKNRFIDLASNWIFQGMLIRTWSARLFRLVFEIVLFFVTFVLLSFLLPQITAIILSIVVIHTFNWTFNGNLWGLLIQKQRFLKRMGRTDNTSKITFLADLKKRARDASGSVVAVAVFGSLSRGEFSDTSDIDVRIVRKSGVFNCFKANVFAFYLRSIAFVKKIPLDLYVLDEVEQMKSQMRSDEPPIVIYDPENLINGAYDRVIPFDSIARCFLN